MDYKYGEHGQPLPLLDLRDTGTPGQGHSDAEVSLLVIALTGMMPGNYGDIRVGNGDGDYIAVTRVNDTQWRLVHVGMQRSYEGPDAIAAAQFVHRYVTTRIYLTPQD